jgi:molybdenum cofactor guanylyltransferase
MRGRLLAATTGAATVDTADVADTEEGVRFRAADLATGAATGLRADTCGIVLAGGRSLRFGRDKLSASVGARPLLILAVEAVAGICEEVVVTVAAGYRLPLLPSNARAVIDPAPYRGPLTGLLSGALASQRGRLLVVGGDMPTLVPDVLLQLLDGLSGAHDAAVLGLGHNDDPQPLPCALRREALLARGPDQASVEGRSLRWLLGSLDGVVVPGSVWRRVDPKGLTLRDVDEPGDLADEPSA